MATSTENYVFPLYIFVLKTRKWKTGEWKVSKLLFKNMPRLHLKQSLLNVFFKINTNTALHSSLFALDFVSSSLFIFYIYGVLYSQSDQYSAIDASSSLFLSLCFTE